MSYNCPITLDFNPFFWKKNKKNVSDNKAPISSNFYLFRFLNN